MLKLQSKLSMPLQSNAIKCNTRKSLNIFQDFNKRKSPSVLLLQSKLGNSFLHYAQQSLKLALVPIQPPIYPSSHQKLNFSFQMVISNSPSPPPPSQPVVVANFRKSWEELNPESERADDYGLGQREGLQVCSGGGGEGLRAGAAGGAAGVSG